MCGSEDDDIQYPDPKEKEQKDAHGRDSMGAKVKLFQLLTRYEDQKIMTNSV